MSSIVPKKLKPKQGPGPVLASPHDSIRSRGMDPKDVLEPRICWQAINSRDRRFDGRFFAGATTTGLYCRNVCPVPFAKRKNMRLFAHAAAAEAAGFRPCKRCQPQAASMRCQMAGLGG